MLFLSVLVSLSQNSTTTLVAQRGGTYVEGVVGQPASLNPLFLENQTDHDIAALVFSGLTRLSVDGRIEPDLARTWEISDDQMTYTFHLRDDVFWHDGNPFSAVDVLYTIRVLQDFTYDGDLALAEVWRTARVEMVDPLTIRVTLPQPYAPFLSFTAFGILPEHLLGGFSVAELPHLPFSRHPIGTGGWRVVEVGSESITLAAHPEYYGPTPMLDRVVLRFYPDAFAILEGYRRGEVLGLGQVSPQAVSRVAEEPTLTLWSAPRTGFSGIVLNLNRPLFTDLRVRQALLYGLDRQTLIAETLNGQGLIAHSFIVPTNWAYNPGVLQYPFSRRQARELLDNAGWVDQDGDGVREKDGTPLAFTLVVVDEDRLQVRLAEEIAQQWARIGASVEVNAVSLQVLERDILAPRDFDAAMITILDLPSDPDPYPLFHSSQAQGEGRNFSGFASARADRLMVEGRNNLDPQTRREIYFDLQEIFAEQLPMLPLYHPVYNYAIDNRVRDVQIGPLNEPGDRFRTLSEWFIRTRRVMQMATPTPAP